MRAEREFNIVLDGRDVDDYGVAIATVIVCFIDRGFITRQAAEAEAGQPLPCVIR